MTNLNELGGIKVKTITLRLDDFTYRLFNNFAQADHRPISNMIELAARKHLEECLFVSETEQRSINNDEALSRKLRAGSHAARSRKGRFVD